ncbi:ATP-binding protein [Pendulispora albinea]|uniref:histidine kinase n=1 Tax=Pendulispora albinea TaxID=2741071 RepID=A0ABZ2LVB8_9BACT
MTHARESATSNGSPAPEASSLFAHGGEMGAMMSNIDWASTPLGAVEGWSQALRTMVGLLMRNRFPLLLWWGPKFIQIYNDAYKPIPGAKHPRALAQPAAECWGEIWDIIGPMIEAPFRGEPATTSDDLCLLFNRKGFVEEAHYKVAYSPVPDESVPSGIGGVLATVAETTEEVYARRQLATLRDLAAQSSLAKTAEEACEMAARTMEANDKDIPCAFFYLLEADGKVAKLVSLAGLVEGDSSEGTPPPSFPLDGEAHGWPVGHVMRDRRGAVVDLGALQLPCGAWDQAPRQAVILPLAAPDQPRAYGAMVIAASPHRELNEQYQSFFELAAEHVASAIRNARAYQQERERAEKLAELDRAKTLFFSNISHEFRTPLTLMLAPIEDMRNEQRVPSEAEGERIDLLHRNALRLLKLVNTLLDFSRIEAGRIEASYEPTDLSALTAELASNFRSALERAGLGLDIDCPPLPEAIHVDHDMWEKIVLNLLSNAFKFTFDGTIRVRLRAVSGGAELEVSDTGTGIAEAELPRLFERFHRIEGARSRSYEGSGIGLALVQELVQLHGGGIQVRSRLGEGTTFCVRIPDGTAHLPKDRLRAARTLQSTAVTAGAYVEEALRWVSAPAAEPAAFRASPRTSTSNEPLQRILVADDNADMRDYLVRLLRERWEVQAVSDGQAALEAIRQNPPDLVLSDVMMPGLDGFALLRALRSDMSTRALPVVLLSARAGEEATAEGLKAGADDYLVKPFTARELFARITARLVAVRAARASNEQRTNLYRAFMQAPFPVAIFRGAQHVIELANEACLNVWGKTAEILGRPFVEGVPEIRDQPFPSLLDGVYRSGLPHHGQSELAWLPIGPGGRLQDFYFTYVLAPLLDARGAVDGIMVCAFDVTEHVRGRQRAEALTAELQTSTEALHQSEKQFHTLADTMPLLAWYADPDGRIPWYNQRWFEYTGMKPEEPEGWRWESVHDPEDLPRVVAKWTAALASGEPWEDEFRLRSHDGQYRWFLSRAIPLRDARGRIVRWFGTNVDVDDQKRLREEAEVANRLKDEFLATMSHELRTPLNAILGWAALLQDGDHDPPTLARALTTIERNAKSQARLIEDILDVSRIINGKMRLDMRRVDVKAVADAARDVVQPAAEAKSVGLTVEVKAERNVALVGDADRLQQVLWNLLINAVKFTPSGGHVSLRVERVGNTMRFIVRDTGRGIPAAHLPFIFERFRQVDSSMARKYGGLGLGLAITRHIAELHGGSISVESTGEGHGSTFIVSLPIRAIYEAELEARAAVPAESSDWSATPPSRNATLLVGVDVLVVDDDEDSRVIVQQALTRAGASVSTADSARAAMDLLKGRRVDVLISDIGMPEEDGFAFIQRIRSLPPNRGGIVPAIALTAYARSEDAARALRVGYQRHLAKPAEVDALVRMVAGLVERNKENEASGEMAG